VEVPPLVGSGYLYAPSRIVHLAVPVNNLKLYNVAEFEILSKKIEKASEKESEQT
jgi:hypothetical protein